MAMALRRRIEAILPERTIFVLLGLKDQFSIDGDLNRVSHDDASSLARELPNEPEILSIDRRRRFDAAANASSMVERGRDGNGEGYRFGHSMHRQIARHRIRRGARSTHACRNERDRGVLGNIEKVRAFEVRITLFDAGGNRVDVNGCIDFGIGRRRFIQQDGSRWLRKHAPHFAEDVLANEFGRRVFRVELPL